MGAPRGRSLGSAQGPLAPRPSAPPGRAFCASVSPLVRRRSVESAQSPGPRLSSAQPEMRPARRPHTQGPRDWGEGGGRRGGSGPGAARLLQLQKELIRAGRAGGSGCGQGGSARGRPRGPPGRRGFRGTAPGPPQPPRAGVTRRVGWAGPRPPRPETMAAIVCPPTARADGPQLQRWLATRPPSRPGQAR